jgi:hypothetical protein
MKKIIILSVIFMMLAGSAFAQLGGVLEGFVLDQRSARDGYSSQGDSGNTLRMTIAGANDDGTFSGFLRLDNGGVYMAYVWWRPIPQVGLFVGRQNDGIFETANIVAHNFSSGSYNAVTIENYNYHSNSWGGSWKPGNIGYAVEIKPVDGLAMRLAVQHAGDDDVNLKDRYKDNIYAQLVYSDSDIGQAAVTYGAANNGESGVGHIGVSYFNNSLIENVAFELGFGYNIELELPQFGFGFQYMGDGWFFKTRGQAMITDDNDLRPLKYTMDFLHGYDAGIFEFRVLVRTQFYEASRNPELTRFAFALNPYIIKRISGGRFSAGIQFRSRGFAAGDAGSSNSTTGVMTPAEAVNKIRAVASYQIVF